jgi:hypothetical protein
MNLGGLTTLARYRPRNLVHVVFDNESLLSVGGFPTATATGTDLAGIAVPASSICSVTGLLTASPNGMIKVPSALSDDVVRIEDDFGRKGTSAP